MVETQWGPLGPADRDLMFKVKQAGLWEMPAAEKANQKSTKAEFADASKRIMEGHQLLDRVVDRAGLLLGVELPKEPNADQQTWLGEMDAAAAGDEFEAIFANRLRAAHGKVYGFVAQMRAGTKNELIRILCNQTMITVLDHIKALEATGKVDFNSLETVTVDPPAGAADQPADDPNADGVIPEVPADSRFTRTSEQGGAFGDNNTVFFGALVVLIGALVALRMIARAKKSRRKSSSSRAF